MSFYLVQPDSNTTYCQLDFQLFHFRNLSLFILPINLEAIQHYTNVESVRLYIKLNHKLNSSGCVLRVNNSLAHKFINKRTIITLNKNNDFAWIKDWLFWHYKHFGIDTVIIGDNASTEYSAQDLRNFLRTLPFIKDFLVLEWNFKYTLSHVTLTTDNNRLFFTECQTSFLNLVAKNHLELSQGFLQLDIDELLIPNEKGLDPFVFAQEFGWVGFASRNIFVNKVAQDPSQIKSTINHLDHDLVLPAKFYTAPHEIRNNLGETEISTTFPKYCACPSQLKSTVIYCVHLLVEPSFPLRHLLKLDLKQYFYKPLKSSSLMQRLRVLMGSEIYLYTTFHNSTMMPFKFYHCRVLNKAWRQEHGNRKLDWLRMLNIEDERFKLEETSYIKDFFTKYANTY